MSGTSSQPDRSPADRTVAQVREALSRGDTACVTKVLEIIQELSGKADQMSVQELAEITGRDLTTVAKIMKAANCLGYNPSAVEVTTLPEAIGVIGFETIRNLVISLLLIESAEKRTGWEQIHEVAAVALCSALTAQAVAQRVPGVNPEQAFVCGALRHYGRLLMSTFLPDQYLDAVEMAREGSFDAACQTVFGLSPSDLGRRILSGTNVPALIQLVQEPTRVELMQSKKLSDTERLMVVSEFSAKVCEWIETPSLGCEELQGKLDRLLKTCAPTLELAEDDLREILAKVDRALKSVGQAQGYQSFGSLVVNRIGRLAEGRSVAVGNARVAEPGEVVGATPASTPDALEVGLAEVERLIAGIPVDARKVFSVAARAVKNGLRFRSCLVFLQESSGPMFSAEVGCGLLFHEIRHQPLINPAHKDVFTVCLARGEDVLIRNPDDASIAPFIPGWFRSSVSKGPLALFPVKDSSGTFAVICGVMGPQERTELTAVRLQQLKRLRNCLGMLREPATDRSKAA